MKQVRYTDIYGRVHSRNNSAKIWSSSVKDAEHYGRGQEVVATRDRGWQVVVVLSAMGDSTDALIAKARNNLSASREIDMLLSTGEQVSILYSPWPLTR